MSIRSIAARWSLFVVVSSLVLSGPSSAAAQQTRDKETGLDPASRLAGLSTLWKEAAYNFPYFEQVPDLDWDSAYREAIPRVLEAESTLDYYRELQRFAALLRDGHTGVQYPDSILRRQPFSSPWVRLEAAGGGEALVANVSQELADSLPIGSTIVEVEGLPVERYLEQRVLPYVFASAPHSRRISAIEGSHSRGYGLLVGPADSAVQVVAETPAGGRVHLRLVRDRFSAERTWSQPVDTGPEPLFEFERLESDVIYLALNSFSRHQGERLIAAIDSLMPELRKVRGIVLDLRENGGGSDFVAVDALARFSAGPFVEAGARWRVHDAYYRALGSFGRSVLEQALPADSLELVERALRHYRGDAWHHSPPDTIYSDYDGDRVTAPVALLIGRGTGSAAENLLNRLPEDERFFTVGSPTAASTGQPLVFDLPGGGQGQVVTRAVLLRDGTLLTRTGILPDVPVTVSVEDVRRGRDSVLKQAVQKLIRG